MRPQLFILSIALTLSACATHRTSIPEINEPPRQGLTLRQPVLVAINDARTDRSNSATIVAALEEGIAQAYGQAVESFGYYEPVPPGRVAVRIRLLANGADFGSRIVSATVVASSFSTARATAPTYWLPVVTVAEEQTNVATAFAAEGWWVGTSELELQIVDALGDTQETFLLPIVAEERESNTLGYRSAGRAAQRAWGRASQQLFRVMDSLLMTLRDRGS